MTSSEPPRPAGDTKDWTWTTERRCAECGYDPNAVGDAEIADALRGTVSRWRSVLGGEDVRRRPAPAVWSPLEYACHVRDVHRVFAERLALMLAEDGPTFPNWDQDAAAVDARYWEADPAEVVGEMRRAVEAVASGYDGVRGEQWSRTGLRGDGGAFTVSSLGRYHLHDVVHHLHDVGG